MLPARLLNDVSENRMDRTPEPLALEVTSNSGNNPSAVAAPNVMFREKFPSTPVYVLPYEPETVRVITPLPPWVRSNNVGTPWEDGAVASNPAAMRKIFGD